MTPVISEAELLAWAMERFARIDDLAMRAVPDLQDRQMVETFVDRIEVNPDARAGVVYLMSDLESALLRSSTWVPGGERKGHPCGTGGVRAREAQVRKF